MAQPHVIELALDLARMPALARTSVVLPLPPNIIELMRIAAASPEACQAAVAKTGEPGPVVIEAARFYLQQVLFRPDADCYRILGIKPSASREMARSHMRWLMEFAGGKPIIEYCGGTELGGGYIVNTVTKPCEASVFNTPALGLDVVILDEAGKSAEQGEMYLVPPAIGMSTSLLNRDHHEIYFPCTWSSQLLAWP